MTDWPNEPLGWHDSDSPAEQPHPFDGQFEPPAEAVAKRNPCIPLPEIAQASIAISLKRIADLIEGPPQRQGILDSLAIIADRMPSQ